MKTNIFSGVFTALATPMRAGEIAYSDLESLVDHQLQGGIDGLVSVGTTGESPTLNKSEHLDVIRATIQAASGKVPIYAGTGSNSTSEAIELTKGADAAGADGFLVVAPYYNKPSQEGLFQHFSRIAEVTEKPIILYSIPGRCGIEISVDVTARLYEQYPHVCCMKAAEGSCEKVVEYVRRLGPDYAVMSGDDGLTLPFMSAGATGVISVASNLVVAPLVQMVAAANANDYASARASFLKYYPLFKAIFLEPNPVPIKYALMRAGIIQSDEVRLPLSPLTDTTRKALDPILEELELV
ncbi:4-hydroxy-tetrahydrodipicolinate synthase [Coraliomargarita akajimensis]|uniref:4-hydroxy-tetrahydrodipicolinate synthase n=1 Tax=Coraliomargarita akajimensis (strain DSM 45221 / IAM 15411 / JCM 23193 / KCTC 12865 / 04OKA010-24) TaxID=583355 RepID=D5EJ55_CORAD|nr:4-hydroxy-tetrahydrodipicolinate synthase [Coraliomargarita akajimensis]ADE54454.1 dihydrodipicolinate synthase [Coraliomargarita akajimensis DSM 45221]